MRDFSIVNIVRNIKFKINTSEILWQLFTFNRFYWFSSFFLPFATLRFFRGYWFPFEDDYSFIFWFFLIFSFFGSFISKYIRNFLNKFLYYNFDLKTLFISINNKEISFLEKKYIISNLNYLEINFEENNPVVELFGSFKVINVDDNSIYELKFISFSTIDHLREIIGSDLLVNNLNFRFHRRFTYTKSFRGLLIMLVIIFIIISGLSGALYGKSQYELLGGFFNSLISKEKKVYELVEKEKNPYTFKDIKGYEDIKNDFIDLANLIKSDSAEGNDFIPAGSILYGSPGTGKTMIASAFASALNSPFVRVNGSDLASSISMSEKKKNIFLNLYSDVSKIAKKRKLEKIILYIDEMDKMSSSLLPSFVDNFSQNLSFGKGGEELLSIISGPKGNLYPNIFLIATVNNIKWFSEAFIRSGRISFNYHVRRPTIYEAKSILSWKVINFLEIILKKNKFNREKININKIAELVADDFERNFNEKYLSYNDDEHFSGAEIDEAVKSMFINSIKERFKIDWKSEDSLINAINGDTFSSLIIYNLEEIIERKKLYRG